MTDAATSPTYRLDDGIAVVTLDDGKANALSHAVIDGLHGAIDRAEADGARALVLAGREGRFSAGFDLATMTESVESMRGLVIAGAKVQTRLYGLGLPTVAACTGHALAAGAIMLLVLDHRVGGDAPAKIGLNEVGIGMALPVFAVELARERLTRREFGPATMQARIYDPAGAVEAGYLDRVVPAGQVVDEAIADARRLAELRTGAYARTKQVARQAVIDHILATLEDDLASISGPDAAG
ncbi:MAG: Enoyl-CoA hydratase/isomerase [Acidimicrobiales bacterium]|nr:Enoyl-CoA hydratase/isomerase [Acidimicrobiales bacterium]